VGEQFLGSFDVYFGGVERGEGHMGQESRRCPRRRATPCARRRAAVGDTGGAIEAEVEVKFGSGRR
jgi:hypothetical protein